MFSPPPAPRYDIKQNFSESLRAITILGVSSVATCACLFGLASVKSLEGKIALSAFGLSAAVIGKLAGATYRERNAIIGDIEDISAAARTTEIATDMSPMMTQPQPIVAAIPSAINPSRELHRSAWLKAKEDYLAGKSKMDIIQGWGYSGHRYPIGQKAWNDLTLEFGDFETKQEVE